MTKNLRSNWAHTTVGHSSKGNRAERIRKLDGYHTPRVAVDALIDNIELYEHVWEPANGFSRISRVLEERGFSVSTSDIHRWHRRTQFVQDFLKAKRLPVDDCDIVTNPPFVHAAGFAERGLRLLKPGGKICLLLRLQFLEGQKRKELFTNNRHGGLKEVLVFSKRLPRMRMFRYKGENGGSVLAFAWFVFEKGWTKPPIIRWI